MKSNLSINIQKAQGMVEFAMVLPILLLIIMGIIGFGHLFFSYSSTVSASREAARFGAAVGVTSSGVPRYLDCDQIRASAVRMGGFAGVKNTVTSVIIDYDKGPGTETTPVNECPVGGTATVDPALGDRIVVQVSITYHSIVPLLKIPDFPLNATTRRTIVRSLAVGEAPTAESLCAAVSMDITITYEPAYVGQTGNTVIVEMTASDGTTPTGTGKMHLTLFNPDESELTTLTANAGATVTFTLPKIAIASDNYGIVIEYDGDPDADPCYDPAYAPDDGSDYIIYQVLPAVTQLDITADNPDSSTVNNPVVVSVKLMAIAPSARYSGTWVNEKVTVTDGVDSCQVNLVAAGTGSCTITLTTAGLRTLTATYAGDANYLSATDTDSHLVLAPPTPTLISSPTPTMTSTPVTPTPVICPNPSNLAFNASNRQMSFRVTNPATWTFNILSLTVTWPTNPIAYLTEIRYGTGSSNNLYSNGSGASPPTFSLTGGPFAKGGLTAGANKTLRLSFSRDLTTVRGKYTVFIQFDKGCSMTVDYTN